MIFRKRAAGCAVLTLAFAGSVSAIAQEVTTYNYDSLRRLTGSSTSGGPNNGTHTGTCFDKAGNRVRYAASAGGSPSCATQLTSISSPDASQTNAVSESSSQRPATKADWGS
jgi:hypothetical protein